MPTLVPEGLGPSCVEIQIPARLDKGFAYAPGMAPVLPSTCSPSPDVASCRVLADTRRMAALLEYVGNVHIFLGPYRGNPVALYLKRNGDRCIISPKVYPWNGIIGIGETPNKAAADFEEKWKAKGLAAEMYTGPTWEGGIKPERPKPPPPPKPAAAPGASKPASPPTPASDAETAEKSAGRDPALGAADSTGRAAPEHEPARSGTRTSPGPREGLTSPSKSKADEAASTEARSAPANSSEDHDPPRP